jgi:hypothetical protein
VILPTHLRLVLYVRTYVHRRLAFVIDDQVACGNREFDFSQYDRNNNQLWTETLWLTEVNDCEFAAEQLG